MVKKVTLVEAAPLSERWSNRALFRLLWPLVVEQLLAVTIGMVDTVMVNAVGESAVSGVSLVDAINVLLITAFASLATGGAVVTSQYVGRRDSENASLAARQLVYSITLVSVVIMVFSLLLRGPMLRLIYGHIAADVMENAMTYFWLSAVSYPFLALYNAGAALFRSMGQSRVTMWIALLVNVLNIGGNSLLIFGLGMGVAGAAISTLISRAVAAAVIIFLLIRPHAGPITLKGLGRIRLIPGMIANILRIGLPNGLESSMFQIGKLLVARIISTFGTAAIAGNAIAGVITSVATMPGSAFGLGLLTVVGQCVGAHDIADARKYTRKLMKLSYLGMTIVCLVIMLLHKPLVGMFHLSAEGAVVAEQVMWIFCICAPFFWSSSFALPNALRAAGDARFTMLVSIFSMWTFRIGLAWLFAVSLGYGVAGVWAAMVVDWIIRSAFFMVRWARGKWENKQVIKD